MAFANVSHITALKKMKNIHMKFTYTRTIQLLVMLVMISGYCAVQASESDPVARGTMVSRILGKVQTIIAKCPRENLQSLTLRHRNSVAEQDSVDALENFQRISERYQKDHTQALNSATRQRNSFAELQAAEAMADQIRI